jgi:hypothetical protein
MGAPDWVPQGQAVSQVLGHSNPHMLNLTFAGQPAIHGPARSAIASQETRRGLLQLRVFRLGLLQNGDVWVGVFPQCQEILIGGTGFGCVALQGVGAGEAKVGKAPIGELQTIPR